MPQEGQHTEAERVELLDRAERLRAHVDEALAADAEQRAELIILALVHDAFDLVARWAGLDGSLDTGRGTQYYAIAEAIAGRPGAQSYGSRRLLGSVYTLEQWSRRPALRDVTGTAATARWAAAVASCVRRIVVLLGDVDLAAPPPWPPPLERPVLAEHRAIAAVLAGANPSERMRRVLDQLEAAAPDHGWEAYRDLPYDDEVANRRQLLVEAARTDPPDGPIGVMWCGIYNPVRHDEQTRDTYLWGGPRSLVEDEEWECMTTWEPRGGYVNSSIMHEIHRCSHVTGSAGTHAEVPVALAYAATFAIAATSTFREAAGTGPIALRVGYDGGDRHDLGDW